ncbi:hypothetical protein MSSIT_0372 [Methanosarcina siciliae T4/M]|uniref:Uncharacterized protein n=2 Tax=Methanosarcina siciliae TaxID=38027 RepID=A0A0E3L9Y0_9EURY|nr:hypothetical protein [Methanosarcina siciliae]AKB27091.1 hypothetical protein MSSIT_0372 [Methanosarcina siciliae T4/M]AKB31056.1 hypothetical protein MSSIH_0366 [Methanosarcina siciliae HI350]
MEENRGKRKDHSIIVAALLFFLLVFMFALVVSMNISLGKFTLPFYLIVSGTYIFATSLETEGDTGEWIASFGWTLNMLGLILFYQYRTGDVESWAYVWPLIFPTGPGLGKLIYGAVKARSDPFERGKVLIQIGLGLFVLSLIVFKLLFQLLDIR